MSRFNTRPEPGFIRNPAEENPGQLILLSSQLAYQLSTAQRDLPQPPIPVPMGLVVTAGTFSSRRGNTEAAATTATTSTGMNPSQNP